MSKPTVPLRSEAAVQREALAIFKAWGVPMQRRNTRVFTVVGKGGKNRPLFCGEAGDSDLTGTLPGGRRIDVEVKREGWSPSKVSGKDRERWGRQLAKLIGLNRMGGVGMYVTRPETLHEVIPRLLRGARVVLDESGNQRVIDED